MQLFASSCLSARPHGTTRLTLDGFPLNFIFEYFSKICRENSSFIKTWQEKRVLYMKTNTHFWSHAAQSLEWKMFQTNDVKKIKIRILRSITSFFPENRAVREEMWKNIVEPGRPQTTIWRMCIVCLILKAINTHSEYVILVAFPLQQWSHERASMLRHSYTICLVNIILSSTLRFPE